MRSFYLLVFVILGYASAFSQSSLMEGDDSGAGVSYNYSMYNNHIYMHGLSIGYSIKRELDISLGYAIGPKSSTIGASIGVNIFKNGFIMVSPSISLLLIKAYKVSADGYALGLTFSKKFHISEKFGIVPYANIAFVNISSRTQVYEESKMSLSMGLDFVLKPKEDFYWGLSCSTGFSDSLTDMVNSVGGFVIF